MIEDYFILETAEGGKVEVASGVCGAALKNKLEALAAEELGAYLEEQGYTRHSIGDTGKALHFVHSKTLKDQCTGFYHQVIEQSHDEIYVCDGEGRTLYCNKAFERNYGLRQEDMIGKTAMYLVEQGYSDRTPIPEVIRTRKQVIMEQRTATGRILTITATPHLDSQGEIVFIIENCRDKTELEAVQNRLKEKELEAQRYKVEAESIKRLGEDLGSGVVDTGTSMNRFLDTARRVAQTDATILIQGESGTGKSHLAQFIHQNSKRSDKPFISINCSTIAPSLFESELFGYAPGAFTGAGSKGKTGLVELAGGGTLFLDEIGEVPLNLQAKLLEMIQEKRFLPVGALRYKTADVKILAATNRNLKTLVEAREFREDLYYRLKVIELEMPALRERKGDIDGFLNHFLMHYNREYGFKRFLSTETREILQKYHWPGNIRELQNLIHSLVIMAPGNEIFPADLPGTLLLESGQGVGVKEFGELDQMVEAYEKAIIQRCFDLTGSSYKMAKALKISQSKSSRLIRKYLGQE